MLCPPEASGECRTTCNRSSGLTVLQISSTNFSGLTYSISIDSDFSIKKIVKSDENVFINEVISTTFQFLRHFCKQISSPLECNLDLSLSSCFYGTKNDHSKTGLGSSAVVTVLLTISILKCFAVDCTNEMLFALAYRAHAIAQGKVGSGFDIAACLFGSHSFQRSEFGNIVLMSSFIDNIQANCSNILPRIKPIQLASFLKVSLVSVGFGSKTPGLVKTISEWAQGDPEKRNELFEGIDNCTRRLYEALTNADLYQCKSIGKVW